MAAMTSRAPQPVLVPPAALAALAFGAQHLLAGNRAPSRASGTAGAVVLAGSVCLLGGALARFRRQGTTVNPVDMNADALVTSGPNSLTRNPMYAGMTGVLIAHTLARRSVRGLIPAALFVAVIDRQQIPAEEALLRERFGADFEQYASTTPRWIGLRRSGVVRRLRSGREDR